MDPIWDLSKLADDDLPRLWGEVMEAMLDRGVVTTRNNPIADLGEKIAAEHLGGRVVGSNAKGYDVKVGSRRIQVKAARITGKSAGLSPIRSRDFDAVVVVLFDPGLRVIEILELDRKYAEQCWKHSEYVSAYLLSLSKIRKHPRTRSIEIQPKWRE